MIERYTRPQMGQIWSEEHKYRTWLRVEILACEAYAELGQIPKDALKIIQEKADFSISRILEIEEKVKHDVIAFLTSVAEYVGPESRYIHLGMTSSDLLDTSLAVLMREAGKILVADLRQFHEILAKQAKAYKDTVCIGRTHGVHSEPISFGLKFALWYDEIARGIERMERAIERISFGKISGAVGTFAYVDPKIEEYVCQKLELQPAPVSTQIIQRDRHAEYLAAVALIGCTLEKIAVEIRHLQRTEVREAEEPFSKGQKGSSAMPHKRNPIGCENISGLARLLRSNAMAAMENIALWHERDISHSSVERVIIPDSTILLDYMLARLTKIIDGLEVYPQKMLDNLNISQGLIFSQAVMLVLVEKGYTRENAYQLVQSRAMHAREQARDFKKVLIEDTELGNVLTKEEIEKCFDARQNLRFVDYIYHRIGLVQ